MQYPWPGNVRELKSTLEYAFVVAEAGLITEDHLPPQVVRIGNTGHENRQLAETEERNLKTELMEALDRSGGNQTRAAQIHHRSTGSLQSH